MTHIWGPVEWWTAAFDSYKPISGELVLTLIDGTTRKMEDWGEATEVTSEKLKNLKRGDAIKVGTWGGRNKAEWFCDIEKINL